MLAVLCGVAAALIFAGQFVVSRYGVKASFTPYDLVAIRYGISGVIFLPVLVRYGLRDLAGIGWKRGLVLALTGGVPYTVLLVKGVEFAPASHGAVINPGLIPVFSLLFVWILSSERPGIRAIIGLGLIGTGVASIGWGALTGSSADVWWGDVLFGMSAALWAMFTVLMHRWSIAPVRGVAVIACLSLLYLPIYSLMPAQRLFAAAFSDLLVQGFYQGVMLGVLAMLLYGHAVRRLGASRAALFPALVPVLGTLLAIPILGEIPSTLQVCGMVLVCLGMVAAQMAGGHRRRP